MVLIKYAWLIFNDREALRYGKKKEKKKLFKKKKKVRCSHLNKCNYNSLTFTLQA